MTGPGIIPYDLAGNWCEECGQAKSYRMWPGLLTGCATCDEVVTRHRCTGRPELDSLDVGASWTCPDCDTIWAIAEEAVWCPECGCRECRTEKRWTVSVPGDRIGTAPRHKPQPYAPLRVPVFPPGLGLFPSSPDGPYFAPFREGGITPPRTGKCYRAAAGFMVHVRPGCRCPR